MMNVPEQRRCPAMTIVLVLLFSFGIVACSTSSPVTPEIPSKTLSGALTLSALQNARYTIVSPIVRSALTSAGIGFSLTLHDGAGTFPRQASVSPYNTVRLDPTLFADGDLNGDGERDMVGVLRIGDGDNVQTEVVAVTLRDGLVTQLATFPLGSLHVKSLRVDGRVLSVEALTSAQNVLGKKPMDLTFSL